MEILRHRPNRSRVIRDMMERDPKLFDASLSFRAAWERLGKERRTTPSAEASAESFPVRQAANGEFPLKK